MMSSKNNDHNLSILNYLLLERVLIAEYYSELGDFGTISATAASSQGGLLKKSLLEAFPWLGKLCDRETFVLLLKASNFDVLSFVSYYSSALYRAGREVRTLDDTEKAALGLDQAYIWARHSRQDTDGLCFNMKRKARRIASPTIIPAKSEQAVEFIAAVRGLLIAAEKSRIEILGLDSSKRRDGEMFWWAGLRLSPTWNGVSATHRDTLYRVCVVIATMLESMFSEPKRFKRLLSVHRKLPQSFLTTSLYIINPAPFISKIIQMYLWKPSLGTWSLCQRMGSSICGVSKTLASIDSLRRHIDESFYEKVQGIISLHSETLSCESDEVYQKILKDSGIESFSKEHVEFLKLSYRLKEKMAFVDHLGDPGESPFLKMCSEILPPLLNELAKVGTLHAIVSSFFDLLNKFWGSLEKYHDRNLHPVRPSRKEMVLELADHFHKFVKWFFPMLFQVAMKNGTKSKLPTLTFFFDCLFGSLLGWNSGPSSTTFHQDLNQKVTELSVLEQESLWKWVETVCEMAVTHAQDESEWPSNEIVEKKLVPCAILGYMKIHRSHLV